MNPQQPRQSLLMTVASRLPTLVEQADHLESIMQRMQEAKETGRIEEDISRRVERWAHTASSGLEAAEKLIASELAHTLAEAAIQLMLAVSKAQVLGVATLPEAERAAISGDLERLLQSAMPVVADAAGIDLSNYGRSYYADRRTDPFYRGSEPAVPAGAAAQDQPAPHYDPMARLKAAGFAT